MKNTAQIKTTLLVLISIIPFLILAQESYFVLPGLNQIAISPAQTIEKKQKMVIHSFNDKNVGPVSKNKFFLQATIKLVQKKRNGVSMGLSVYKNVLGQTEYGVSCYKLALSDQLLISHASLITFGISGNWNTSTINRKKLQWDDQFTADGFHSDLVSNENIDFLGTSYLDFSGGIIYQWRRYKIGKTKKMASYKKIEQGVVIAVSVNGIGNISSKTAGNQGYRASINVFLETTGYTTNGKLYWTPQLFGRVEGNKLKVNVGGFGSYYFKNTAKTQLNVGLFYTTKSKITPYIEVRQAKWKIGLTYDVLVGEYRKVRTSNGGFGVQLVWMM